MNKPLSIFGIGVDAPLNQISEVSNPSRLSRQSIDSTNIRLKGNFSADQPDALGCSVLERKKGPPREAIPATNYGDKSCRSKVVTAPWPRYEEGVFRFFPVNKNRSRSKSTAADSIRSIHRSVFRCANMGLSCKSVRQGSWAVVRFNDCHQPVKLVRFDPCCHFKAHSKRRATPRADVTKLGKSCQH